jgi:hypothetical protein
VIGKDDCRTAIERSHSFKEQLIRAYFARQ